MVATISPSMLADLRRRGEKLTLIDVRTPAEFGEVHVDFARNIPLDRLDSKAVGTIAGGGAVYVICKSGNRSQKACEKLVAAGLDRIVSVEGGTNACVDAGLPIVRGRKVMSLDRQVRIAAGILVATGAAALAGGGLFFLGARSRSDVAKNWRWARGVRRLRPRLRRDH